ncbi:TetR/AcrR family transcriptional regulator [Actinoplanes bogorensis]|uniref:TetR/AcrR family transcriptional regulator n=1 Tax=Paractinoplanes bogorensis TaxID=1610840 RepID=A0ABS5YQ97_9ACTN|nr:TetR/AcrR family transcriptional regulator [Actinoplanes bogorensis]MBU2665627.1 TetR/AcrR family transcriptional regulator [Actinoplanes bogorensis]
MPIPYEASGRVEQKSRTRRALVEAARGLLAEGATPRVEDAAIRAAISRTTAYRYFANQRALLLAAQPQIQPDTLLGPDAPVEPRARLDAFMGEFTRYNLQWEPQLRSALRLSLEDPGAERPLLRRGRAIGWIEDALSPLADVDRRALAIAIRSAAGIESLIWLIDVAGQTRPEAAETVRRTASALLEAALAK